jgi:hypothetical protein
MPLPIGPGANESLSMGDGASIGDDIMTDFPHSQDTEPA